MTKNLIGLVPDMSNDEYHAHPAIGSSGLKRFMITPLHYWASYLDPDRESTDAKHFRIGRAWHCAVFEPHEFGARFAANHDAHPLSKRATILADALSGEIKIDDLVALPDGLSKTSKEGKALVAELQESGKVPADADDIEFVRLWFPLLYGKDVLSEDHIKNVSRMASVARGLPISKVVFGRYAEHGAAEHSIFWTHPGTGVQLKIRPDYMLRPCAAFPDGLIIDGKSTQDASEEGFARQVWNLDYGMQASLYTTVFREVFKTAGRPAFLWLAQEKESPFGARYYAASGDLIGYYDAKIEAILPTVAKCLKTGVYPGYPETVSTLGMPAYAQKQIEGAA